MRNNQRIVLAGAGSASERPPYTMTFNIPGYWDQEDWRKAADTPGEGFNWNSNEAFGPPQDSYRVGDYLHVSPQDTRNFPDDHKDRLTFHAESHDYSGDRKSFSMVCNSPNLTTNFESAGDLRIQIKAFVCHSFAGPPAPSMFSDGSTTVMELVEFDNGLGGVRRVVGNVVQSWSDKAVATITTNLFTTDTNGDPVTITQSAETPAVGDNYKGAFDYDIRFTKRGMTVKVQDRLLDLIAEVPAPRLHSSTLRFFSAYGDPAQYDGLNLDFYKLTISRG